MRLRLDKESQLRGSLRLGPPLKTSVDLTRPFRPAGIFFMRTAT